MTGLNNTIRSGNQALLLFFKNMPLPFRNFLSLVKYGAVYQALYFLTIPIVLAKFSAESFGVFTIIFSVASVVGVVSALRVERALVIESMTRVRGLLMHCTGYVLFGAIVSACVVSLMLKPFDVDDASLVWLVGLAGVYSALFGAIQVFSHLAIRESKVRLTGVSDVFFIVSLLVFLIPPVTDRVPQELYLLIIYTAARFISLLPYTRLNLVQYFTLATYENTPFSSLYRYYVSVITTVVTNIQFKGMLYLSGVYFGSAVTGNVSMAQRVVYSPVNLLGSALRKSFFLEFANNSENFEKVHVHINRILIVGSIISLAIYPLFVWVLSYSMSYVPADWSGLGGYATALYPAASVLVLLSWLDRIYDVVKKQPKALFYEVSFTLVLYFLVFLGISQEIAAINLFVLFSTVTVLYNCLWAYLTLKLIKMKLLPLMFLVIAHCILLVFTVVST